MNQKVESKALVIKPKAELVLEGDPESQLAFAQKAAKALMARVNQKERKVIINGKQYLEFGDWQTLARFFGSTVGIEWTKKIEDKGKMVGYEARAIVYQHGETISSAEASCMTAERNWANREEFAVKSMAQTRASAKALRNAFGWVAELAGYQSTPAEEMTEPTYAEGGKWMPPKPEETKEIEQKKEIVALLSKLGYRTKKKEEYETKVYALTKLDLIPENYEEIISRLAALVSERENS